MQPGDRKSDLISRRRLLLSMGHAATASILGLGRPRAQRTLGRAEEKKAPAAPAPISGDGLYKDLIAYYNLGEHRTASTGDSRTSDWLADRLKSAGLKAAFQYFSVRQFFLRQAKLEVGGAAIQTFPLWFPSVTAPAPLRASLSLMYAGADAAPLKGKIALVKFPFDPAAAIYAGSGHLEIIGNAARAGALAVVAVTEGPTGELIAMNSPPSVSPWPIPVALVPARDEQYLGQCATRGVPVSLLIDGQDRAGAQARNVVGKLERGRDVIVVSTPQSGWFRCAAERGPGIALWLALAGWARRRDSRVSYLFVSTSGHEVGRVGMASFIAEQAPPASRVLAWLHLGAGIAAYHWEQSPEGLRRLREPDPNRSLMCSPDLALKLQEIFEGQPGLTPVSSRRAGELENIMKAGYRSFGIVAAHRYHHTPADNPDLTGPELLEPVATALARSLEYIETLGGPTG